MKILYFAWLRQRIGSPVEEVSPPAEVVTVAELVQWLKGRDAGHAAAFRDMRAIRCAVNQQFAPLDRALDGGDEVAFFPPLTGG